MITEMATQTRIDADKQEVDSEASAVVVYHCWLCAAEFFDKLGIIQHLKAEHADRKELQGIERKMIVPICITCGSTDPCEHQTKDNNHSEDTVEEEYDEDNADEDNNTTLSRPRVLRCVTCGKPFHDPVSLREHRQKEHPDDKSYQCAFCTSTFVKHSHLVVHTRIHTGSRPYICTECGNRFPKSSDLKRHSRVHSGEKPFKCALCSQTFTQKSSLEKHAKIHAKHIGGHPCLMCGLVFVNVDSLNEHTETTHQDVSWKCKTCGKMFAEERHLLLHEKSHLTVKAFACSFCPRNFSTRSLLVKHEETIHACKDIKCGVCGKEFKRRENLTRHMSSHSGVKSHKCPTCGIMFTEKGSLTRHTKAQHDLIRPHVCMICARSFTRKILLRKHMDRVHVKKDGSAKTREVVYFRCKLCQKLLRKPGMTQHMKYHRLRGDIWDGSLEDNVQGADQEGMGIKQEAMDCEQYNYSKEGEGEKVTDKVNQWDSGSEVDNSDTETESVGMNTNKFHMSTVTSWNDFNQSGHGRDAGMGLQYVQDDVYQSGTGHRLMGDGFQGNMTISHLPAFTGYP